MLFLKANKISVIHHWAKIMWHI